MNKNTFTVGLFGTCGHSTWRSKFIESFNKNNIKFYNPQLGDGEWIPDRAAEYIQIENYNLKNNELILFPVTDETTAQGSLAEIGFSVADTIRNIGERYLIIYVSPKCNDPDALDAQIEDSERSRKLVHSKCILESQINPKVFLTNSLQEMHKLSLEICEHLKFNGLNNKQDLYMVR
jgi:hypothetical protein